MSVAALLRGRGAYRVALQRLVTLYVENMERLRLVDRARDVVYGAVLHGGAGGAGGGGAEAEELADEVFGGRGFGNSVARGGAGGGGGADGWGVKELLREEREFRGGAGFSPPPPLLVLSGHAASFTPY